MTFFHRVAHLLLFLKIQNLVPNYSFEGHDTCFFEIGSIKNYPDFDTKVGVQAWLAPTLGNPDYYNSCNTNVTGANVPMYFVGYQYSKTGNAYVGFMNGSLVPNNIA